MSREEEIAQQLKLLEIQRRTLRVYITQKATLGVYTPPNIILSIEDTRKEIQRIKVTLRDWEVLVEDHPDDEEYYPTLSPANPVPAQPTAQSKPRKKADDGLPYDIYISYHPIDKAWVRSTLLPQLESAGLRVIVDYRDFAIGVPKLVNIEQAVDQSRHTLIVMTPEWVDGEWQAFQSLLAQTSDPAGRRAKLLPLMLKPCTPPSRIAELDYADLTDEAERGEQIDGLLRSLAGQPARDIGSATSQAPKVEPVQEGTATVDQRSRNQVDGPALRRLLIAIFNDGELRDLCFDLGIDYEDLPGQAKGDKARELVAYASRRGRMDELISQARSLRPNADWQSVGVAGAPAPAKSSGRVTESVAQPASSDATEQQVDFVIITALEEERDAMLSKLPKPRRIAPSNDDIYVYYSAQLPITFSDDSTGIYNIITTTLLGMGRVQAANATSAAIRRWKPRYVLLVGIAGGIAEANVKIGDILISNQVVDYELQKQTAEGSQIRWEVHRAAPQLLAAISDFPYALWKDEIAETRPGTGIPTRHIGPIASGDKVIAFQDTLTQYRDTWPKLIGVEMEAAGAASAVFNTVQPPGFFMIRGVSDLANAKKGTRNVDKWRSYACDVAAAYTSGLLKSGPVPLRKS
jgi:nucleoside phosphorylase